MWKEYHYSLKAGPATGPAIFRALSDLAILPDSLVESIRILGGELLSQKIQELLRVLPDLAELPLSVLSIWGPNRVFRRIEGIQDKEGKTRVIAMLDFWSQTALRPLHLFIFDLLREIPQDMTFSQGSFVEKVSTWGEGVTLYSVDLSSATDRFPIDLIADVLRGHFPQKYVAAWVDVMVGYPFRSPDGSDVTYSVGNPMGAYSSWSSFALAHHFVMFWCCEELGQPWRRSKYVILGDDVLIGDVLLGDLYRSKILSLGIGISEHKSYTTPHLCEFAKRYLYRGEEVSPFPLSSVIGNLEDVSLLVSALQSEERKGLVTRSGIPDGVEKLSRFLGHRRSLGRRRALRARDSILATELVQGKIEIGEFLLKSSGSSDPGYLDFIQSRGPEIFSEAVKSLV